MADIDYGELRLYPGNYDNFMIASTQAQERLHAINTKKSAKISDLKQFVSRFSANASKAKQATSRAKQLEKIKLEEIKPSSRVSPYIRFNQTKKLYRQALTLEDFGHSFEHESLFNSGNLILSAGTRLAIIGENGSGKTTFLRCLMGELKNHSGLIQWAQNASLGYCPQDSTTDFECEDTLFN
jgi:ATPase subunit of ABC transporter with duplicated ATPase domains